MRDLGLRVKIKNCRDKPWMVKIMTRFRGVKENLLSLQKDVLFKNEGKSYEFVKFLRWITAGIKVVNSIPQSQTLEELTLERKWFVCGRVCSICFFCVVCRFMRGRRSHTHAKVGCRRWRPTRQWVMIANGVLNSIYVIRNELRSIMTYTYCRIIEIEVIRHISLEC